jgi:hypothetical protein
MKTKKKLTAIFLVTVSLLISCNETNNKKEDTASDYTTFEQDLKEKQIGKSGYYISIPTTYSLKEVDGSDFSIYYFYRTDSTGEETFSGGLYFGNHPHIIEPDNESCKKENLNSRILDDSITWTVYDCNGEYSIQTIVDSTSEGWKQKMHAFGNANSKAELRRVLHVFRTMKKNK